MPEALMGAEARPTKDAVIAQSHGMHYTPVPTLPMDTQARREKTLYADDDSTSPRRIVSCRDRCGGEASVVTRYCTTAMAMPAPSALQRCTT